METLLGIFAALAYGSGDFVAGLGSRRIGTGQATVVIQVLGIIVAIIAVVLFPGQGPSVNALAWGAGSGLGSAIGTLVLYRGLAIGQMSVVAPLSAVVTVVLPVIVGVVLGEKLSIFAIIGIGFAVPAIALVSFRRQSQEASSSRSGITEGLVSGIGFSLLFIALDQAGNRSGAWPLIPGQAVAFLLVLPFGWRVFRDLPSWTTSTTCLVVGAGFLGGLANLLFLGATSHGKLAIAAVLTSLFPAVTILLARFILVERLTRFQAFGLVAAAASIALISIG